ncbi:hypothetical protein F7F00_27090, partial [Escherichia coli]
MLKKARSNALTAWRGPGKLRNTAKYQKKICSSGGILRKIEPPRVPGECFICELRLPDHRFRWKHNKLFLLLPEEYGPAFP